MSETSSGVPPAVPSAARLLRVEGLCKDFPGLRALDDVSLDVHSGEIVAVVGHNGSGKSTLVKILGGVYTAEAGTVELGEEGDHETELHIIHQDLGVVSQFSAIENLGMTRKGGVAALSPLRRRVERRRAKALLETFDAGFDVDAPLGQLAPAQRSIVAIARALAGWKHSRNVLVLDEPTEALHASEVSILFDAVKKVAANGAGVIFISHRLDEVLDLADRVVVLRDGRKVADIQREGIDHDALVAHVTGAGTESAETRAEARPVGVPVLEVDGLVGRDVRGIDLVVHAGEVVGVAGVLGSGRDRLPALLFGSQPSTARSYRLAGRDFVDRSPRESIRRGMGFVPGDRGRYGSVPPMTATENITLPELRSLTGRLGAVHRRRERAHTTELMVKFGVRPLRTGQMFSRFSGGNQQKIVFAKWLRNRPKILLLEEPTQGVDIGAKQAIYAAIDEAAAAGAAVVVSTSDAKELVRLCDRVIVLRDGEIAAEVTGDALTEKTIIDEGYGIAEPVREILQPGVTASTKEKA